MESLRSILLFYMNAFDLAAGKLKFRKITQKTAAALLIKSIEYLNFRHFRQFRHLHQKN